MLPRTPAPVRAIALLLSLTAGCLIDDPLDDPPEDIADALATMDGVRWFEEHTTSAAGYRLFEIVYEQPVDHGDPDGPTFDQQFTLLHRSFDAPMVLASTGYHNYLFDRITEPTHMLAANQIIVEHRYFGGSRPEPADWSQLTVEQAAADHHRIVEALAPLYTGPWVSTGSSKGGMTAVFHRRFHPGDVDATIAYVAPISFAVPDPRYEPFFDDVGEPACRQEVRDFQRDALARRVALEPLVRGLGSARGLTFERIGGIARALESGVVEFEWGYWQYLGLSSCDRIPDSTADDEAVLAFLERIQSLTNVSDQTLAVFEPYFYQSFTQIGYPAIPDAHLEDLRQFAGEDYLEAVLPESTTATFDPAAMRDIADWVTSEGERLMFIYGEHDPWTGGAFDVGGAPDAHLFVVPEGDHGARIGALEPEDEERALDLLETWTGITPAVPFASPALRRGRLLDEHPMLRPLP